MNKIEKLQSLIKKAESFLNRDLKADNPEFEAWNSSLIRFSEREYGKDSITTKNFKERSYSLHVWTPGTPESYWIEAFENGIKLTVEDLKCLIEEEEELEAEVRNENINNLGDSKKVFIVHGRDESKKYELYGFLHSLGLEPIILHEQVNNGKTIIEKIEDNSDVACAIILLTPDDEGKLKNSNDELKTRARQNVIFEAGYFMGKLGRKRTILISNVEETMSDINGIVYLDLNNYKYDLMKELKELKLID